MQKLFWLLIGGLILLMPACITIEENYTFKRNGSGDAQYIIDMSEMGSLIKMAQEEEGGGSLEEEMDLGALTSKLENLPGIKDVSEYKTDKEYVFGVSFSFDDISSLNIALNALMAPEDGQQVGEPLHEYFKMDGKKTIIRDHKMLEAFNPADMLGEEGDGEQMMMFMESMKYKVNMTFKKPIMAVYTEADAELMGKKNKQVGVEASFRKLMDNQDALDMTVVMK
jgi:hypothetical protein